MLSKHETTSSTLSPGEYVVTNEMQRQKNIHALELLEGSFGSEDTLDHQFLDVGCGTGDFTRDCLLPRCPPCRRIVAADVSEDMVQYAREHFSHPKICYDVLDIASEDVSDFIERYGEFDRVYSFFCFHWMRNQEQICESCIPPTVDLEDKESLIAYIKGLLKAADLTPTTCEILRVKRTYSSLEHLIRTQMALNRLTTVVTEEERPLLLRDVTEQATKWWAETEAGGSPLDGQAFLVHAFKPRS
ncbi:hypothetical protein HPB47_006003 [Ixodes persulcatus]|uniref:Uncharacterized protein n=1 Tax=Ixodes persulcatus TaxID=34615 RepID=A0AC60PCD6_IXOPE|nr:hypothetical protein HPB47_006003 [Ixodes persulcatus]